MSSPVSHDLLPRFSAFIAQSIGLHFPPSRYNDLSRAATGITQTLGLPNPDECIRWLLTTPLSQVQLEALASHLTIGETYFFRDRTSFAVLERDILPPLIEARRSSRHLRIWSAACCTGEEPYSIAIVLSRLIPDIRNWSITLIGTDINPQFLQKAQAGIFSAWSFRDAPPWLKDHYFTPAGNGRFTLRPSIRRMVQFRQLNLVSDAYPSPEIPVTEMDIVFCRNALMYFTEAQTQRVVQKLYSAQTPTGWLFTSPSELLQVSGSRYSSIHLNGSVLFRKGSAPVRQPLLAPFIGSAPAPAPVADLPAIAPAVPRSMLRKTAAPEPVPHGPMAYSLANQGNLAEALVCCERWIATDKLNPNAHYLRAVVLQELGRPTDTVAALRQTLYVDPDFALAHFTLGHLAQARGQQVEAVRHLRNALHLLRKQPADQILSEFDGMTAGRGIDIIESMLPPEERA